MKISKSFPPNFRQVVKAFPAARGHGVIFTYGDTIFNPSGVDIPPCLMEHEQVHSKRQGKNEDIIEEWWGRYIASAKFRFEEEVLAHEAEYRWYINSSKKQQKIALNYIARRLASPMYGSMTTLKRAKAQLEKVITHDPSKIQRTPF